MSKELSAPNAQRREQAAVVLTAIGPPAAPALPALRGALEDLDEGVRRAAQRAVKAIETP